MNKKSHWLKGIVEIFQYCLIWTPPPLPPAKRADFLPLDQNNDSARQLQHATPPACSEVTVFGLWLYNLYPNLVHKLMLLVT